MKYKILFGILASGFILAACNSKQEQAPKAVGSEYIRPASMDYSAEDSAAIHALGEQFLNYFNAKDFESAAQMLHKVRHDSIIPYTDEDCKKYVRAMEGYRFYGTSLKSIILRSDKNNEYNFYAQIVKDGDASRGIGVITVSLNPVYKDGHWYLTLLDKDAEGVKNVYEEE